ncbi:MAG TPA: serine/threonine-protein kinase [Myxococcaceae bacterium]|jgi:tetratricopeptide (TPR) repeat protein
MEATETFETGVARATPVTGVAARGAGEALAPGTRVGRYVVLRPVGSGGMGRVYAAHDPELDRQVALKVARRAGAGAEQWRARFLREAHAMARLSHPNVVPIHDVGTHGEAVFLAMELVEGPTLREWMSSEPGWREVVRVFTDAGRGLAAAHAIGLVHRDFKPSNVLLGKDLRARVMDFGLVRALDSVELPVSSAEPSPLSLAITRADTVMGTVGYMAPEQQRSRQVDARADQFAFAVALYEALQGHRPYLGDTADEILEAMEAGPPSLPDRVPRHVRRAVARALSAAPLGRFPSIDALLDELARDPAAKARRWALGSGAVLAAAALAAAVTWAARERARACDQVERELAGVWDSSVRDRLRAAFTATGKSFAADAAEGTARALDAYARQWAQARGGACVAARVEPASTVALRAECLDGRKADLTALVGVLLAADGQVVQRAADSVSVLQALEPCANAEALRGQEPIPQEPAMRARVRGVREQVSQARALLAAGRFAEAAKVSRGAAQGAEEARFGPLVAEAHALLGAALDRTGDVAGGERALERAVEEGTASRQDWAVAEASVQLVRTVGLGRGDRAEGLRRVGFARAALRRAGTPALLAWRLDESECELRREQGEAGQAIELCRRALAAAERSLGPENPVTARAARDLGTAYDEAGQLEEALGAYQRAMELERKVLGERHPEVAVTWNSIAITSGKLDRWEAARDAYSNARDILAASVGEQHPFTGLAAAGLGRALHFLGDDRGALKAGEAALPVVEAAFGPTHPWTASPLLVIGEARLGLGDARGAISPLQQAQEIVEKQPGDPPLRTPVLLALGKALWTSGVDRAGGLKLVEASRVRMSAKAMAEIDTWLVNARGAGPTR